MPSRSVIAVIVVFWLAVTGWAAWRTLAPYFRPNDPPPFVIDLLAESGQQTVFWQVFQNTREIGDAESDVRQDGNGLFLIGCRYKMKLARGLATAEVYNRYHVAPDGEMRGISAEVKLGQPGNNEIIKGQIEGPIKEGVFHPRGEFELVGKAQKVSFDPVDLGGHRTVVNPLHPVSRIYGLRAGRTWQVPLFDPLTLVSSAKIEGKAEPLAATVLELLRNQQGTGTLRQMSAEVLPEPVTLRWEGAAESCWVIEYHEGKLSARTWVRQHDGLVLKQEARLEGDILTLIRKTNHD